MKIDKILPQEIEKKSFEIIEQELPCPLDEKLAPIIKRVIHTTADFDYVENLYFSKDVFDKALTAIRQGATIITDTNMAKSGINKAALAKLGGSVECFMADEDVAKEAKQRGTTRATVSMEKAARLEGKTGPQIFAIGNAPTALIELERLMREDKVHPALVIGVPVGFVNVVAAKELIIESGVDCIVARGRKGGSNVAAAIINALMYQAVNREELSEPKGHSSWQRDTLRGKRTVPTVVAESKKKWDSIAKPVEGLGLMEDLISRIAGAQNQVNPCIAKKAVLVFCADNGVVKQNISQVDSSVTANIVRSIQGGTSSVAIMAKSVGADVFVYDVGVLTDEEGVIRAKYMYGTKDISEGPAMTREVALKTIETGMEAIAQLKEKGYQLVATGEAGIGNTTTSAAIAGVLLGMEAEVVTGKGSGLTEEAYLHKIEIVKKAWQVNAITADTDVVDVIAKVGGLDIAALTGAYLGAARNHMPIIMDGIISAVAALCACMIEEKVKDYIIPSHMSMEPAMVKICERLELSPVIHANMHLGEGTGAVLLMPMLDTVMAVYNSGATFEHIDVKPYERLQ